MPKDSLTDRLAEGPTSIGTAGKIVERMSTALDIAHSHGVIQRDLEPSNILFDENENAFLADFGIAMQAESAMAHCDGVSGTPAYHFTDRHRFEFIPSELAPGINRAIAIRADSADEVARSNPLEFVNDDDPLDLLRRVANRVVSMHASDRYLVEGKTLDDMRQNDGTLGYSPHLAHGVTGQGLNDYDAIFTILSNTGFNGWISIEDGMNGLAEMQQSLSFLRKMSDKHFKSV